MRIPLILGLAMALAIGCGGGGGSTPVAGSPGTPGTPGAPGTPNDPGTPSGPSTPTLAGAISFQAVHSTPAAAAKMTALAMAEATTPAATVFNFGNLPSTGTYLFQIQNTGTAVVNDVVVTADNPAVIVTPGTIAVLPLQGTGSIVPLTEVQVIHGVGINGHGTAPLLAPGALVFHLTATGTDTTGATVSATCEVDLNVQVAQFAIEDYAGVDLMTGAGSQPAPVLMSSPFTVPVGSNMDTFPLNGWYLVNTSATPALALNPNNAAYTVVNKGNVPLTVTDYGNQYSYSGYIGTTSTYTVAVGASKVISMTYNPDTTTFLMLASTPQYTMNYPIIINSGNVVFKSDYPADSSGNFFIFNYWIQLQ